MNLEELRKRLKEINAELDDLLEQLDGDAGDAGERMTAEEIETRSNELEEEAKGILTKIRIE